MLKEMAEQTQTVGKITSEMAAKAIAYEKDLKRLAATKSELARTITFELIGPMTAVVESLTEMAKRADGARNKLAVAAKAAPDVPEIAKMIEVAHSAGLKLNNERDLTAAADGVSTLLASITGKYDGSTMAGLDSLIPGPDKFKGTARKASALN